jgi:hypothetical protein
MVLSSKRISPAEVTCISGSRESATRVEVIQPDDSMTKVSRSRDKM